MDWLEQITEQTEQPEQTNPTDQSNINDAFDKIAVESFEPFPTNQDKSQPTPTSEKQKGHKFLSKKKQGKRK